MTENLRSFAVLLLALAFMSTLALQSIYANSSQQKPKSENTAQASSSPKTQAPPVNWDLSDLVKNEKQWQKQVAQAEKDLSKFKDCQQGQLTSSAQKLAQCLSLLYDTHRSVARTCSWAFLQQSTNSLVSKNTENAQKCQMLFAKIGESSSFYQPEIIAAGKDKIQSFLKSEPRALEDYSQFLRRTLDQGPHSLSPEQESILSALQPTLRKSGETFRLLLNAEIEWPKVKMSDGKEHVINVAAYTRYRQSQNRDDRQKAFEAFYKTLSKYERTFGSTYGQAVLNRNTMARLRNYNNALDAALKPQQLPESVYRRLISEVQRSLPTLHRYLKLRGQLQGIKKPEYIDVYPTVVASPKKFPLAETQTMTLAAMAPLGKDYVTRLTEATSKPWMSVYPTEGKSSGAFMSGSAYDVHPYVFLNHQDDYNSASTYAHEWGHALHSILSNQNQPYPKAQYATFVAEIAAITNELLLSHYAIENATTKEEKLYYLNEALEAIRTTYFRQAQFAEFELKVHEVAAKDGALTGQKISEIYGDIQRRYYGHNKKVMNIDPLYFKEWMFVPHFYSGFYVFQYSTSMAGAYFFADKILSGDQEALKKYLNVLKAGGSKYPHEILLEAGLDLSKGAPYRTLDKKANELMNEIERLVKENPELKPKA